MTLVEWNGKEVTLSEAIERLATLTRRQHEILALRCPGLPYQGMPYKEIADQLNTTEHDVKTHMSIIYQKLGLDNLPQGRRIKALNETFCPLLSEGSLLVADPDEKDPV